jgi:starch synthase
MTKTIRILFLAAEAEPFVKVGGLADVSGALPLALRRLVGPRGSDLKLDIRLVLPQHRAVQSAAATARPVAEFPIYRKGGSLSARVSKTVYQGMTVYWINGEPISSASGVYSTDTAEDREKYCFFSLAAVELTRYLDWRADILHANDWHTALVLYALRARRKNPEFNRLKTVLTLHNLPYMGGDGSDVLTAYGLTQVEEDSLPDWSRTQPLPLGLWSADAVIPVSPTYAREILTPEFGCGLETYLRGRADSITGILNGLDVDRWNPETDRSLAAVFTVDTLAERAANKAELQKQLGLPVEPRTPLFAMIGRVDPQKGVDITLAALALLGGRPWQFVLLGAGVASLEEAARSFQSNFPARARVVTRFDPGLSRTIYAGADVFLMPSRYEPCGLAQMIAMRYGCVPVVRMTGGLKDTVQEGRTGFLFEKPTPEAMAEALDRTLMVYASPAKWHRFQRNGMKADFSWPRSAEKYALIYRSLIPEGNSQGSPDRGEP